ncbi:MAG: hypothetical protein ACRELZ_15595 [Candidatus Rokuibacteriota bacterium]
MLVGGIVAVLVAGCLRPEPSVVTTCPPPDVPRAELPVFSSRVLVGAYDPGAPGNLRLLPGIRPPSVVSTERPGDPARIDPARSLLICDTRVVEDPERTWDLGPRGNPRGVWTAGHLLSGLAREAGQDLDRFVRDWLEQWSAGDGAAGLPGDVMAAWLLRVWERGAPGARLTLEHAPFRLLAIVNRLDLIEAGNPEARLVFAALDEDGFPTDFTLNFEYVVSPVDVRAWAQQWKDLDRHPLGSPRFNRALERVTEQFTAGRPMRIRTNRAEGGARWELREFVFDGARLAPAPVKQTPPLDLRRDEELWTWVRYHAPEIGNGAHRIPERFPVSGRPFLALVAPMPPDDFWVACFQDDCVPNPTRHLLALATCNGCHSLETFRRDERPFQHIRARDRGLPAPLSPYLTGTEVPDPSGPDQPVLRFAELLRWRQQMDEIVNPPRPYVSGRRGVSAFVH